MDSSPASEICPAHPRERVAVQHVSGKFAEFEDACMDQDFCTALESRKRGMRLSGDRLQ